MDMENRHTLLHYVYLFFLLRCCKLIARNYLKAASKTQGPFVLGIIKHETVVKTKERKVNIK